MPSPTSEIVMPAQRTRKSRYFSGASRPLRASPPGRSSASWLCCIGRRRRVEIQLRRCRTCSAKKLCECRRAHRLREQVALPELTAEFFERGRLFGQLDSFSDNLEREARAERDDRGGQRLVVLGANERTVHL